MRPSDDPAMTFENAVLRADRAESTLARLRRMMERMQAEIDSLRTENRELRRRVARGE